LKFLGELWAGRACAGTNQQELTTCAKSAGQYKKKFKKKGEADPVQVSIRGQRATAGRQPAQGNRTPTTGRRHPVTRESRPEVVRLGPASD
jgi:hypothetical protein